MQWLRVCPSLWRGLPGSCICLSGDFFAEDPFCFIEQMEDKKKIDPFDDT